MTRLLEFGHGREADIKLAESSPGGIAERCDGIEPPNQAIMLSFFRGLGYRMHDSKFRTFVVAARTNMPSLARLSVLLSMAWLCSVLSAAIPTGTIAGSIQDPSGAVVAVARVTATALETGATRAVQSGSDGEYLIPLLPVGTYRISVEAPGFDRFEQVGIVVRADQNSTVPVTLTIGSATQAVTVQANAQMVETRSGALSQVISERNIIDLPLNGRNPAALILLTPATADLTAGNARGGSDILQTTTYPGAQSISAGGGRDVGVNYNLDGGNAEDFYSNVSNPFPNPDAVEEFSVISNSFSAQYGRASGAIVNVVTKSGTNQFHGGAFEFLRNGDFNARNFFAASPDPLKRSQFGGTFGGPIMKDKLFFFGSYQGTVSHDITLGNSATVPTAAERNGDFSALSSHLVNPYAGNAPYPNNRIPQSQLAPASLKVLQLVPLPTTANGLLYYGVPLIYHENQILSRVDYDLSAKHRFFARYFYTHYVQSPNDASQNLLTAASGSDFQDQTLTGGHTWTISPNMVNTAVFSFVRDGDALIPKSPFSWPSLGVPIASPPDSSQPEVRLSVSGWFSAASGHLTDNIRNSYNFSDSLHWVTGKHEIAFGGDYMRQLNSIVNIVQQSPYITFSGTAYTGNPMSDFMIGDIQSFTQGGGQFFNMSANEVSLFVEDKYRVNRSLVLTLGLRWDPFVPYTDSKGRFECFRPGEKSQRFINSPQGYIFAGDPGCPSGAYGSSLAEFGPRFGFAYNPGGKSKTVLRGGWGLFYQPPNVLLNGAMVSYSPFDPTVTLNGVPLMNPYQSTINPFPAQYGPFNPPSNYSFILPLSPAVSISPNYIPAEIMNWNLTLERQLTSDILVRAAYVGSTAAHLSYDSDPNAPLPSPTATHANEQARRPYQQFGIIYEAFSGANSNYNALELSIEKRFSKGVSLTANYTWSKSIDTNSFASSLNSTNNIILDPYNRNLYRGVSDFNVPQNFVLNYVWELPSPKQRLAKAVLGGWSTAAIWTWQSGFPLNISSGGDYSYVNPDVANDQAQQIGTPQYTSGSQSQRLQKWFTTSAYAAPAPNTFGNVGRNTLIGPGTFNIDLAVHRIFSLSERFKLQFRAECFDFPNHPEFNNPNTTLTANTFGAITTARNPRILQLALKLNF